MADTLTLPDSAPGHWDTPEGAEKAREYVVMTRVELTMGSISDLALANAQFLCSRNSFELIHYQTAAKERIRWLSAQNVLLLQALEAFLSWAGKQCPCENEEPNPCPLCGASVENLEACKAIEAKFPRDILANARAALAKARSTP